MHLFFKAQTPAPLYNFLEEQVIGTQSIREKNLFNRLLPTKYGSEEQAQQYKDEVAESVHGHNVHLEIEKQFASEGCVIPSLNQNFKDDLITAVQIRGLNI